MANRYLGVQAPARTGGSAPRPEFRPTSSTWRRWEAADPRSRSAELFPRPQWRGGRALRQPGRYLEVAAPLVSIVESAWRRMGTSEARSHPQAHGDEVREGAQVGFGVRAVAGEPIWQVRFLSFILQQGRRWAAGEASGRRAALFRWARLISVGGGGGGGSAWPYLERLSCCSTAQLAMRPATLVR